MQATSGREDHEMTVFTPGTDQVLFQQQGRVAVLTLNRPEARNALSPELSRALREGIAWVAGEPTVGALVIAGSGSAFCAGGDVKAMGRKSDGPPPSHEAQFRELQMRHHGLGGALYQLRKPTLAVLPGAAAGAGLAIALACDLRIASDNTFLTAGYRGVGLSGDYGIAWLLTRVVGPARAREYMLTGRRIQADEAERVGLLNQVVAADALQDAAMGLAAQLAEGPQIALAYMKDNLDEALTIDHATAIDREADRLLKARSTHDHREAVRAFAEKRPPNFTGS